MSITKLDCMELQDTRYSVYPYDGYNLEEILGKFYEAIKECNDLSFSLQEFNQWLISQGLAEEVLKQLDDIDWDNVVNSELYQKVVEGLKEISEQMKKITIFVTPQMFGAKGDGLTNDTVAFKNALATGKQLVIPYGNYLLDYLVVDGHTIIGLDKKNCILTPTSVNGNFIYNVDKTNFFSLENLTIDFKNSERLQGDGINIKAIKCYIKNVHVNYPPSNGIFIETDAGNYADPNYNLSTIEDVSINMSGFDGLVINKSYDLNLNRVNVSSCGVKEDKKYSCIHIISSIIKASDCHFWNWWGGESDVNYANSTLYIEQGGNNTFTNCHFEGGLTIAKIESVGNLFTNCSFYAVKDEYMVKLGGARNIFTSCRFDANEVSDKIKEPKAVMQIISPTSVYSNIFRDCYYTLPIIDYTLNIGQGKNIFTGYLFANNDNKKNYYFGELNRGDDFNINSNFSTNNFITNITNKKRYHNYLNTSIVTMPTVLNNGNYKIYTEIPKELNNDDFTFDGYKVEVLNTSNFLWSNLTTIATFTLTDNILEVVIPNRTDIGGSYAKISFYSRFKYN